MEDLLENQSFFVRVMDRHRLHYNEKKYWKRRAEVINPNSKKWKIIRLFWLYYIKKCDAFHCASFGTNLGSGAVFKTKPYLPHHLNGIIVGHDVTIGANCTIFQRVTIGRGGKTTIGDNVMIGVGAYIAPGVHIGDNVQIGANAVVTHDVPSNCVAAGVPARVIKHLDEKL